MKKLNLNVMFTIAAVLLILLGTMALLSWAVPSIKSSYGTTDISTAFAFLIIGTAQLVFGVVAWSVRKGPASKTHTTLAYGYGSLFALWAILDIIGRIGEFSSLPGHDKSLWLFVVIFSLLALGFFISGKTSKFNIDN